jgi:hypothetical protein
MSRDVIGFINSHLSSKARVLRAARALPAVAALALIVATPGTSLGVSASWTKQFGTPTTESGEGITADSGGYTAVGTTSGALTGTSYGYTDGYLRRYSHSGTLLWTRQFGTKYQEQISGVAADATGITVSGITDGYFPGYSGKVVMGEFDIFVRRYDRNGNHLWTRQFGTDQEEEGGSVAADGTGVVVVGTTRGSLAGSKGSADGFLRRYDLKGDVLWTRQFGTVEADFAKTVRTDANGFTLGGTTYGDFIGYNAGYYKDAYILRFDRNGNRLWGRQFGQVGDDWVNDLAIDSTGITVGGATREKATFEGNFNGFIRRYDFKGTLKWSRIFGTASDDLVYGVAPDAGGLTVAGYTMGALDGTHRGSYDAFVRRYDRNGNLTFRNQFGTSAPDLGMDVAAYGNGFAVLGHTLGSVGGANKGDADAFIRKFTR